jgi:hypothetical protein
MSKQDRIAISVAVFSVFLGVLAIWAINATSGNKLGVAGVATVLVSTGAVLGLVYGLISGQIVLSKAPGGFEFLKGRAVDPVQQTVAASVQEMQFVEKEGLRALQPKLMALDTSQPLVLTMTLGKQDYYGRGPLIDYLDALLQFRTFRFAVFLKEDGSFAAYMTAWALQHILQNSHLGDDFLSAVNKGQLNLLRQYPGVIANSLPCTASNLDALKEMKNRNLEALIATDQHGTVRGVVERDQLLSEFVLALAA